MVRGEKGQLKLSFGMIFSIILIIVFISAAFFGIKKFISFQQEVQVGQFAQDLQNDVDKMWRSNQGSQEVSYILPKFIENVCFRKDDNANLFFQASRFVDAKNIDNINIDEIVGTKKAVCFENNEGRVTMNLEKDYGEALVMITE